MIILLPAEVKGRIEAALARAGTSEIGGILMGEQLAPSHFRVSNITIQNRDGFFASFVRNLAIALEGLRRYFDMTERNYRRFNYLGEWHSHPSFEPKPSPKDEQSMFEIVNDPDVGANFAILMVVKLNPDDLFEATATVFAPNMQPFRATLDQERVAL